MGVGKPQIWRHIYTMEDTSRHISTRSLTFHPTGHSTSLMHERTRLTPRVPHSWHVKPMRSQPGPCSISDGSLDRQWGSRSFLSLTDELEMHEHHLSFCFTTLFSPERSMGPLNPQGLFRDLWNGTKVPQSTFPRQRPHRGRWPERDAKVGRAQGCPSTSSQDPLSNCLARMTPEFIKPKEALKNDFYFIFKRN